MYKSQTEAVKEWLQAYRASEGEIDKKLERIRELRARMVSIGAQEITDMPKAPSNMGDSLEESVIRLESMERALKKAVADHEKDRKTILDLVSKLKRRDQREIIKHRYIYGYEWTDVLVEVYRYEKDYSKKIDTYRRKMYRAHESALLQMWRLWGGE